jgi:SAM-dependent methyltransferase
VSPPPEDGSVWSRFHSLHYQRHNQRRQEHLASLGLPLAGRSVLEVGAGVGDHASFFLDRGCAVTLTEGRAENLAALRQRFPGGDVRALDLERPDPDFRDTFEVVYCYGVLYHLGTPAAALDFLAARCRSLLLLETCVDPGPEDRLVLFQEPSGAENALHGVGCRPSRSWLFRELSQRFAFVYVPLTQPWHEEFPLDWTQPPANPFLVRAVLVASREPLDNALLVGELLERQQRMG